MAAKIQIDLSQETNPVPDLKILIGRNVIRSLGTPNDMLKVQVNPVGGDRYRVNVFVGKSVGVGRVANSFFLSADNLGNIKSCSPQIARLY